MIIYHLVFISCLSSTILTISNAFTIQHRQYNNIKHQYLSSSSSSSYNYFEKRRKSHIVILSLSSDESSSSSSSSSPSDWKQIINWIVNEPIDSLVSRDDIVEIIKEILSNDKLLDESEELISKNYISLEKRLKSEDRTIGELLGNESTLRLLSFVENNLGSYDPDVVRTFLGSEAINKLFARVLYDGIFEFVQKIDIFGNIISNLPIIGPIRTQIIKETKRSLDKSLGPLVQNFLGTYTKIAVLQASDFVLSKENQKIFTSANVKLVSSLLDRPINTLLVLPTTGGGETTSTFTLVKDEVFDYIRSNRDDSIIDDVTKYVDLVYDIVGDKTVDDVADINKIIDASPTLEKVIDSIWTRARNNV